MLSSFLALLPLLALSAFASVIPRQVQKGTIEQPLPGTAIAPGGNFTFQYFPRQDYGTTTFGVYLFVLDEAATENPLTLSATDLFSTGYFWDPSEYPNVEQPTQLTMPDFSVSPGGFASGMTGSDVKLQLIVLEKYGDFDLPVGLGFKLGLATAEVIYNATSSA